MSEFKNKIALVTGAKQGIGRAIADALIAEGAIVVEWDIQWETQAALSPEQKEQQSLSSNTVAANNTELRFEVDITEEALVASSVCAIIKRFGRIDYLVNAAGILFTGSLLEMPFDTWQKTLQVNTHGAFHVCRYVGRAMRMQKSGAIVAICSNAAKTPRLNMGAYAASKAATTQLIKCLGLELAEFGVRCNVVAPGSTDTPMQRALWSSKSGPYEVISGDMKSHKVGIPLKRIAQPEDVAHSVLFLLSSKSQHITMETLTVDGGATLGI